MAPHRSRRAAGTGAIVGLRAPLIARVGEHLEGLLDSLTRDDARILDVGSGIAALSVAFCRTFPSAEVVGLEPWPPAMELGRANVTTAGLNDRIHLRSERVEDLTESGFDLAWMPAPFLPRDVLQSATRDVASSLRAGGWLVLGRYAAPSDPLAQAIAELRTIRGGGCLLTDAEAVALLQDADLTEVHAVPRDWTPPIAFVAGRRSVD